MTFVHFNFQLIKNIYQPKMKVTSFRKRSTIKMNINIELLMVKIVKIKISSMHYDLVGLCV